MHRDGAHAVRKPPTSTKAARLFTVRLVRMIKLVRSMLPGVAALGLSLAIATAGDDLHPASPKVSGQETNSAATPPSASVSHLVLLPGVPVVVAVDAPVSIRRAAEDLQRDLAAVLGASSSVVDHRPANDSCIEILPPDAAIGAPEAHVVRVVTAAGSPPRVVLAGSDPRGVVYAIYTFSERVLHIPPLWYFADWKPARLRTIDLAADFTLTVPPPHVRWRAWFFNDEDMFVPWEHQTPEEHFDRVLETMLRLKLNAVDLGTIVDYPKPSGGLTRARLARDRGLVITTTHTSPLGTDWKQWDGYWRLVKHQEPPPLRLENVAAMEEFWRYQIDLCLRERFEMIWEVGFRGATDAGFFTTFKDAPTDNAGRAKVIGDMLQRQLTLLHTRTKGAPLIVRTVLYNESSDYLAAGLLHLPKDSDLIWNYVAARRDHFPAADILRGDLPPTQPYGYYLNLQFTSTGAHLASAEGPWKIARNYQMVAAVSPRPLDFWVVNAGNVREFLQELCAHAELAWNPVGWDADAHLTNWCATYFGAANAVAAADVLRRYYNSFWTQRASNLPNFPRQYLFQDMRVARACDLLLNEWNKPFNPAPLDDRGVGFFRIDPSMEHATDQLAAVTQGIGRSTRQLAQVTQTAAELEGRLDANGRRLWHDHVRVPAEVVLTSDRSLLALVRGYRERGDATVRRAALEEAGADLTEMRNWLTSADQPPFTGWSTSEHLWGIDAKQREIAKLEAGR